MKYSYLSDTVSIKKIREENNKGEFSVEGLYTSYGVTIGNALRRVLLSSLPGAAISQIKIKGASHEFSTLPGMVEDIVEFTLNLKRVRFKFYAQEPQVLHLKVKAGKDGEREVTAADIADSPLVEVINKDLHLATLTGKKAELDVELTVEKGLGYAPAESRTSEKVPIGTIMLDCIFSPVLNVDFDVENMRVGERTDYNRVKLTIETDGSITPSRALHQAANILKDHFSKIAGIEGGEAVIDAPAEEEVSETEDKKPKSKPKAKSSKTKKSK